MTDKFFFPLAALVIGLMIWAATLRTNAGCPTGSVGGADTNYTKIIISGEQLNRFITNGQLEKQPCTPGEAYQLSLKATDIPLASAPDAGPHFRLATDIERTASERRIRITVRARAMMQDEAQDGAQNTTQNGAKSLEIIYFTGVRGGSGWQDFPLTDTFEDYSFEYIPPQAGTEPGVDFLGIRPGPAAGENGLEIERVELVNIGLGGT